MKEETYFLALNDFQLTFFTLSLSQQKGGGDPPQNKQGPIVTKRFQLRHDESSLPNKVIPRKLRMGQRYSVILFSRRSLILVFFPIKLSL